MLDAEAMLPDDLTARIPSRAELLDEHAIRVNAGRWRRAITRAGLPAAGPLLAEGEWRHLTRRDVLTLGDADVTGENAVQLFYASLAWGLGAKARNVPTRLNWFSQSYDHAPARLTKAWTAVRDGCEPQECYEFLMSPRGRPLVPFFGAAFATKFLYFAHGLNTRPRNVILDQVVATHLGPYAWPGAPTTAWWSQTYQRYCSLVGLWAEQASSSTGLVVLPDQVELALFKPLP